MRMKPIVPVLAVCILLLMVLLRRDIADDAGKARWMTVYENTTEDYVTNAVPSSAEMEHKFSVVAEGVEYRCYGLQFASLYPYSTDRSLIMLFRNGALIKVARNPTNDKILDFASSNGLRPCSSDENKHFNTNPTPFEYSRYVVSDDFSSEPDPWTIRFLGSPATGSVDIGLTISICLVYIATAPLRYLPSAERDYYTNLRIRLDSRSVKLGEDRDRLEARIGMPFMVSDNGHCFHYAGCAYNSQKVQPSLGVLLICYDENGRVSEVYNSKFGYYSMY